MNPADTTRSKVSLRNHDDSPVVVCPRSVLQGVVSRFETEHEANPFCGVELEFYQFKSNEDTKAHQKPLTSFPIGSQSQCFSQIELHSHGDYIEDLLLAAEKLGCPIHVFHTEVGPSAFEAALSYQPASRMADNVSLFRWLTHAIGAKYGIRPSFMPKPIPGAAGCSGHIHRKYLGLMEI
jgi:glutamine synthetase